MIRSHPVSLLKSKTFIVTEEEQGVPTEWLEPLCHPTSREGCGSHQQGPIFFLGARNILCSRTQWMSLCSRMTASPPWHTLPWPCIHGRCSPPRWWLLSSCEFPRPRTVLWELSGLHPLPPTHHPLGSQPHVHIQFPSPCLTSPSCP